MNTHPKLAGLMANLLSLDCILHGLEKNTDIRQNDLLSSSQFLLSGIINCTSKVEFVEKINKIDNTIPQAALEQIHTHVCDCRKYVESVKTNNSDFTDETEEAKLFPFDKLNENTDKEEEEDLTFVDPRTSMEKWSIEQMERAGVLPMQTKRDPSDARELVEDIDIDIIQNDPGFLTRMTKKNAEDERIPRESERGKLPLGPIEQFSRDSQGIMARVAAVQEQYKKKRIELSNYLRSENQKAFVPEDYNKRWEDPLAATNGSDGPVMMLASEAARVYSAQNMKDNEEEDEWKEELKGIAFGLPQAKGLSMKEQRERLPIFKHREGILSALKTSNTLVIVGETGSGKTTQIPQYLVEEGYTSLGHTRKMVCITQPRRVAAMSVAERVAEEMGCVLGEEVGYSIRFDDKTGPKTRVKFATDGMLVKEMISDPEMRKYSVIMLDEAHERSVATDLLIGLLKGVTERRKDIRVILSSATLDAVKFSTFFGGCPTYHISGSSYPVEILYTSDSVSDYVETTLQTVLEIHIGEPKGDILVFLTGQEEIDTCCERLMVRMKQLKKAVPDVDDILVLPVYSALPSHLQTRIFIPAPTHTRKVIVSTNIAETSLTIDGICYVVDSGYVKLNVYDPRKKMDTLVVAPISQAQARQRAGRAGRTQPGKCYRLYTENAYKNELLPVGIPEIQRTDVSSVILDLLAIGVRDVMSFPFLDPPSPLSIISGMRQLFWLEAIDSDGLLTLQGLKMSEFPLDPMVSKMLLASVRMKCSADIATVAALLSVSRSSQIFYRPREESEKADREHRRFMAPEGDHLSLLRLYNMWLSKDESNEWCKRCYINGRALRVAKDVRNQITKLLERNGFEVVSCIPPGAVQLPVASANRIRRAIVAGFFRNAARKDPKEGYKTMEGHHAVFLHPSSALYRRAPPMVVFGEIVVTAKEYMHNAVEVNPKWLAELAPNMYRVAIGASEARRHESLEPLRGPPDRNPDEWRLSSYLKKEQRAKRH